MADMTPDDFAELVASAAERGDHERVKQLAERMAEASAPTAPPADEAAAEPEQQSDLEGLHPRTATAERIRRAYRAAEQKDAA